MPDNFVEGDALRDAFLELSPDVAGRIDRFGNSFDLVGRMLADPYVYYDEEDDLSRFDRCTQAADDQDSYYLCFSVGQSDVSPRE